LDEGRRAIFNCLAPRPGSRSTRDVRWLAAACVFFLVPPLATDAQAAVRLRVRGETRLEARAYRHLQATVVEGRVYDDAGAPLAGREVHLSLGEGGDPGGAIGCAAGAHVRTQGTTLVVSSDEGGRFCVRLPAAQGKFVVAARTDETELVGPAMLSLDVDTSKRAMALRFDPEPRTIALDDPPASIDAVAEREADGTKVPAVGATLVLTDERATTLATAVAGAAGRATFALPKDALGSAGRGELRVSFAGDVDTMSASHVASVQREARVDVVAPAEIAGTPEDGVPLDVEARSRGGIVEGTVEVLAGTTPVGAATLEGGRARVVATFVTPASERAELRVRVLPSAPHFRPGADAVVQLTAAPPSPWRQAPLAAGALAIGAWLLVGRIERKRRAMAPKAPKPAEPAGVPSLRIVAAAERHERGWRGRVVDAHDGTGIARARVSVERASFSGTEVVTSTFTDADGAFALEHAVGERLVAEGPLHAALDRPLPPAGALEIALVSRRRRILDRFAAWARGKMFGAGPEPTPGMVRRGAEDPAVARWADAVERTAFDAEIVDARAEKEVDDLAPRGARDEAGRGR
jgi:hypothetical protein